MAAHPTGTVTFLFSDIEGSTKLAQKHREYWENLRQRHYAILQSAMDAHNGYVFQIIGDAFCVAFHTASDGLNAAIDSQRKLGSEDWGDTPVKVRMGLHTGEAELQSTGDYHGYLTLVMVQRVMSVAYGGQVLLSSASAELLHNELTNDITLRDMKEHRLKDLLNPERLWQVIALDLQHDFPPLQSLKDIPNNLPVQLSTFIGREREMTEVKQALAEHRLVTLTGSGGAGKTRLSLQVAADLPDLFPNGVWFVELAPITDPELIPQTILSAADVQTQQGRSALDSLKDFLREKTSLVVLDNCEHLIEACAKLADTLLHAAPNIKILASSREALGVKGEQAWHVPSLSIPDLKHLPAIDQLSQYEAVRLFIDRALLVQPHFAVTNDNAPAVAQICSRLDGIPLAIELAAARVKVLKPEQIAGKLNDRFRLLTGGSRTALPRQQTLRALIDWSYDLLSENEKLLLRRLSIFVGGWTLEAAEQVCSDDKVQAGDILDLLTHLVDKSLVVIDEQATQLRYRILETARQYAREKLLESGEGERLRTQHLAYFLKLAEDAEPHLVRTEQLEWFERLELDHENLRAALEWAGDSEKDDFSEAGLRLVNALRFFWQLRGYWTEGREWTTRALAHDAAARHTIARARTFVTAAFFDWDNIKEAMKLCDEGLALGRELGDKPGMAESLLIKGIHVRNTVNNLEGRELLQESLKLFRELNDKRGQARAIYNIGNTAMNEYDFTTARQHYDECLRLSREVGDRRFIAIALMTLGRLEMNSQDWDTARKYIEESLLLGKELGDKHGLTMYLSELAILEMGQGEYQKSQKLLAEAFVVAKELGAKFQIARTLYLEGILARHQKDYEKATRFQKEFLSYGHESNDKTVISSSLYRLGELARLQSEYDTACSYLIEALTLAKEIDDREAVAYCLEEFAALSAAQGQAKFADTLFGAAEALRVAIHIVLLPVEKMEVDKNIAAARAQLDEATFNAAWAEGRAMTMEQAIAYALEETQ